MPEPAPTTPEPPRAPTPASAPAPTTFTFQLRDLPDEVTETAFRFVRDHVTALAIENRTTNSLDPIGSGTFVKWGNHFGILTAEHVVNIPGNAQLRLDTSDSSNQLLRLSIADHPHVIEFDARALRVYTLGPRLDDEFGPDVAIIGLPQCPPLWAIRRVKSFWDLTYQTNERLQRALDSNGLVFIAGHLGEEMQQVPDVPGFTDVIQAPGLVGLTGQTGYFERGQLDYLEVESESDGVNQAPGSWSGVSGGSLWRVPILRNDRGEYSTGYVTLAGVPFRQDPLGAPGHLRVRGHGPMTLYRELLGRLPADA